ncbi:MAG: GldG family protein [Defluviitaleaceae bacterium]|nr:GldG family protein [Defluviitaleaceae bacterium]
MLSMPPSILQEVGKRNDTSVRKFVVVFLAMTAALMLFVNILPQTGDFHNTVGLMGAVLPVFSAWLTSSLPQPLSLFMPSRLFVKYLSSCALFMLSVAASFIFPAVLTFFGEFSIVHILGAYLGLVLLGVSYLSLGVCLRLMIGSAPALGVVSFVIYGCLYFTVFEPRFHSFVKGLPSLGGVVFFASFSVFFLAAAALSMQWQRRGFVTPRIILTALALVMLNIFTARFQLYADLTRGRIFSLSEETLSVLDDLEAPVEIFAAFPPGSGDPYLDISRELLRAYGRHPNVRVSFTLLRRLTSEFGDITPGSVVTIGGGGSAHGHEDSVKIIPPEKLFITSFNEEEMQIYISGINVEAELTNAILYCTSCENPVLAQVFGNSEQPVPQGFIEALISANYDVERVEITESDIPPEVSMLLITTPAADWSESEAARLARFLDNGGSAVFALDAGRREPRRLAAILDSLGIELGDRLVAETQDYLHMGSNVVAATRPFGEGGSSRRVLIPNARAIYHAAHGRGMDVQGVAMTSPFAFEKSHPWEASEDKRLDTFALAARVESTGENPSSATRVVVLGSSNIFDETANELSGGENYRFLIDAVNWIQGVERPLEIPPVSLSTPRLNLDIFNRG